MNGNISQCVYVCEYVTTTPASLSVVLHAAAVCPGAMCTHGIVLNLLNQHRRPLIPIIIITVMHWALSTYVYMYEMACAITCTAYIDRGADGCGQEPWPAVRNNRTLKP